MRWSKVTTSRSFSGFSEVAGEEVGEAGGERSVRANLGMRGCEEEESRPWRRKRTATSLGGEEGGGAGEELRREERP